MSQTTFSPQLLPYHNGASLVSSFVQAPLCSLTSGALAALGVLKESRLSYAGAGLLALKPVLDWYRQPSFIMRRDLVGENANSQVQNLYNDLLHCGLIGENREIVTAKHSQLVRQTADPLDWETAGRLNTINAVLTRVDDIPTAATVMYDLERLYLELSLQKVAVSSSQLQRYENLVTFLRPCSAAPEFQRHKDLLHVIYAGIMRGSQATLPGTLAFDTRSLLVRLQTKSLNRDVGVTRYDALQRSISTTETFCLRDEAIADLHRIRALLVPTPTPATAPLRVDQQTQMARNSTTPQPSNPLGEEVRFLFDRGREIIARELPRLRRRYTETEIREIQRQADVRIESIVRRIVTARNLASAWGINFGLTADFNNANLQEFTTPEILNALRDIERDRNFWRSLVRREMLVDNLSIAAISFAAVTRLTEKTPTAMAIGAASGVLVNFIRNRFFPLPHGQKRPLIQQTVIGALSGATTNLSLPHYEWIEKAAFEAIQAYREPIKKVALEGIRQVGALFSALKHALKNNDEAVRAIGEVSLFSGLILGAAYMIKDELREGARDFTAYLNRTANAWGQAARNLQRVINNNLQDLPHPPRRRRIQIEINF